MYLCRHFLLSEEKSVSTYKYRARKLYQVLLPITLQHMCQFFRDRLATGFRITALFNSSMTLRRCRVTVVFGISR